MAACSTVRARAFSLLLCGLFLASALVGGSTAVALQPDAGGDSTATAFISAATRVTTYQTEVVEDGSSYGLEQAPETPGSVWVVSVMDVTNFGTVPLEMVISDIGLLVTDGDARINGDASSAPAAKLGFADVQPNGSVTVQVDSTVRIAVPFVIPGEALDEDLRFRHAPRIALGDESVDIARTVVDRIDISTLPPVAPWGGAQGSLVSVPGNGAIEVNLGGNVQTVQLAGVVTPPADGCFGVESIDAVQNISSGVVWIESDPGSDGSLVWYWDAGLGHLGLLNETLTEQGYAAAQDGYEGAYASWLTQKSSTAQGDSVGLWSQCRGANGEWINPPTPTPVPTKTADEIRAEYAWIDIRDLVIRPGAFEGQKIAFQGEVFNVPPGQSIGFEMQVYVTTPTGDREAVYVYFTGDASGIYEGTWVTVYGVADGTVSGTNAFGGTITQPLVRADIIDR